MRIFLSLSLIFFMVSACTPQSTPTPITTLIPPTKTLTPVQITATATETITPTSTPDSHLTVNCLEVLPELPNDEPLNGVIVLGTFDGTPPYTSFLLNSRTKNKNPLIGRNDEKISSYSVSPDKRWLAYYSYRHNKNNAARLVIIGPDGRPIKDRLVSTLEWINMIGWVNNQQLLFEKYDAERIFKNPLSTIVYNPFSNEQKEISPALPSIRQDLPQWPEWDEYKYTEIVPDSTLSFIVYQANNGKSILWDRNAQKEIISLQNDKQYYADKPVWSPDGSIFLQNNFISKNGTNEDFNFTELFSISHGGELHQLTNLSLIMSESYLFDYTWSPNMKFISFWLKSKPSLVQSPIGTNHSLAILDRGNNQITDYCIESIDTVTIPGGGTLIGPFENPAIWSPDSQELLIFAADKKDKGMTILINLAKGYAAKVAEDMIPMGWLTDEP